MKLGSDGFFRIANGGIRVAKVGLELTRWPIMLDRQLKSHGKRYTLDFNFFIFGFNLNLDVPEAINVTNIKVRSAQEYYERVQAEAHGASSTDCGE